MKGFSTVSRAATCASGVIPECFSRESVVAKRRDSVQKPYRMTFAWGGRTANIFRTATTGFTLIELLVVVLIIGILSAVAVPQYEKAVEKSRATEAMTILKALREQQALCLLDQGDSGPCMQEGENGSLFDYANITIPGAIDTDCGDPTCGPSTKYFRYALDGQYIYAERIINGEEVYDLQTTAYNQDGETTFDKIGCFNMQDKSSKNWCKVIGFTKAGKYYYFQP